MYDTYTTSLKADREIWRGFHVSRSVTHHGCDFTFASHQCRIRTHISHLISQYMKFTSKGRLRQKSPATFSGLLSRSVTRHGCDFAFDFAPMSHSKSRFAFDFALHEIHIKRKTEAKIPRLHSIQLYFNVRWHTIDVISHSDFAPMSHSNSRFAFDLLYMKFTSKRRLRQKSLATFSGLLSRSVTHHGMSLRIRYHTNVADRSRKRFAFDNALHAIYIKRKTEAKIPGYIFSIYFHVRLHTMDVISHSISHQCRIRSHVSHLILLYMYLHQKEDWGKNPPLHFQVYVSRSVSRKLTRRLRCGNYTSTLASRR